MQKFDGLLVSRAVGIDPHGRFRIRTSICVQRLIRERNGATRRVVLCTGERILP